MNWFLSNPLKRVTRETLEKAPLYSLIKGTPVGLQFKGHDWWDIIDVETPTEGVIQKAEQKFSSIEVGGNPERDDEATYHWKPRPDDIDAALAFLSTGGTLIKLPDSAGSRYWRLYVAEKRRRSRRK